jgi:DNA invertase Pin-like site-specific DNA recombinase
VKAGIVITDSPFETVEKQRAKLKRAGCKTIRKLPYKREEFVKAFSKLVAVHKKRDSLVFSSLINIDLSITALVINLELPIHRGIQVISLADKATIGPRSDLDSSKMVKLLCKFHNERLNRNMRLMKEKRKEHGSVGRPTLLSDSTLDEMFSIYDKGQTPVTKLCKMYEISRNTFYRHLKSRQND